MLYIIIHLFIFIFLQYNYGIKLLTKHTKIRFATNIENKPEIERLISTIILQNDLAMNIPGTGPSLDHPVSDVALSPGKIIKLATLVEVDPKAPFSIATTPRYRGGRYSFPWIVPLYP